VSNGFRTGGGEEAVHLQVELEVGSFWVVRGDVEQVDSLLYRAIIGPESGQTNV